jgi:hypothetical protein
MGCSVDLLRRNTIGYSTTLATYYSIYYYSTEVYSWEDQRTSSTFSCTVTTLTVHGTVYIMYICDHFCTFVLEYEYSSTDCDLFPCLTRLRQHLSCTVARLSNQKADRKCRRHFEFLTSNRGLQLSTFKCVVQLFCQKSKNSYVFLSEVWPKTHRVCQKFLQENVPRCWLLHDLLSS